MMKTIHLLLSRGATLQEAVCGTRAVVETVMGLGYSSSGEVRDTRPPQLHGVTVGEVEDSLRAEAEGAVAALSHLVDAPIVVVPDGLAGPLMTALVLANVSPDGLPRG